MPSHLQLLNVSKGGQRFSGMYHVDAGKDQVMVLFCGRKKVADLDGAKPEIVAAALIFEMLDERATTH